MISVMKQFHMLEWLIVQIYMERFAANIVTNIAWNYNKQWTDWIMLLFLVIFFSLISPHSTNICILEDNLFWHKLMCKTCYHFYNLIKKIYN